MQFLLSLPAETHNSPKESSHGAHVEWHTTCCFDGVARPSDTYRRRRPEHSVLYRVVHDHFETFRAQSASIRDGGGLPRFVDEEFRSYLRCGWLAAGFARFRCAACGTDRLVAFSCKGRGFCPSCSARRMAQHTAHLVDHVFPSVAVRQWVLSLPFRIRYLLAWDHDLARAVVAVFLRTVMGFLRTRARHGGLADGRTGAVAIVQRFGAALNLNVHVHALVLDGVFARDGSGRVAFHEATAPSDDDVAAVVDTIRQRVLRLFERRGHGVDDDGFAPDRWGEEAPVLAGMGAASVQGRIASGPRAGAMVRRLGDSPDEVDVDTPRGNGHARREGFDLHAGVVAPAGHRHRLERLCRYALRPPIAEERLTLTPDQQVLLRLRHRWTDGTTHLLFDPIELLERLAVITPRPRINLILYHGVLPFDFAQGTPSGMAATNCAGARRGADVRRQLHARQRVECRRAGWRWQRDRTVGSTCPVVGLSDAPGVRLRRALVSALRPDHAVDCAD